MNESKRVRDNSLKPCACRGFYATEVIDGSERVYGTTCLRETNNLFAQGHDAKLVSFLVKADLSGETIQRYSDDKAMSAVEAAQSISQALADKTERAIRNALDKLAARVGGKPDAIAKAAKAPRSIPVKVATEPTSSAASELVEMGEWVNAKIGRWTYHGTKMANGEFAYETKAGEKKTAAPGTWTEVK